MYSYGSSERFFTIVAFFHPLLEGTASAFEVFANGSVTDTLKMNKSDIQKLMNEADVRHSQIFTSQERILRRVCVFLRVKLNWVTG